MNSNWKLLAGSLSASIAFGTAASIVYKLDPTFLGLIVPLAAASIVFMTLSAGTVGLLFAMVVEGEADERT